MTEQKRKRGRPKLPTPITEDYAPSRRQAVNAMYMYEAVDLITEAAYEIPVSSFLSFSSSFLYNFFSPYNDITRDKLFLVFKINNKFK